MKYVWVDEGPPVDPNPSQYKKSYCEMKTLNDFHNEIMKPMLDKYKSSDVFDINGNLIKLSDISKVQVIEDELLKHGEQVEIETKHYWVPGVYIREIFMPKGTVLTGKIHKYPQFHVITKGNLSILIDGEMVRLKAPINIMSPAGAKRLVIANEDTTWLMVHGTYETDLERIEKQFTCNTEQEYLDFIKEEEFKEAEAEAEAEWQLSLFEKSQ